MFDIGFSELLLVFVIGLIVLGPQRLPVAVKTVVGWIRAMRSLATTVQNELTQELKLQEFKDSLNKVEKASLDNLTPELKSSMEELRQAAESMKRSYSIHEPDEASTAQPTIHNPTSAPGTPSASAESQPVDPSPAVDVPDAVAAESVATPVVKTTAPATKAQAAVASESTPLSSDKS